MIKDMEYNIFSKIIMNWSDRLIILFHGNYYKKYIFWEGYNEKYFQLDTQKSSDSLLWVGEVWGGLVPLINS